jgi:DNA-directed RNA polymerase specialized sigma24 family protein
MTARHTNQERAMPRTELVLKRLAEGASYADLAAELGIAQDSVRTTVYRARQRAGLRRVVSFEPAGEGSSDA